MANLYLIIALLSVLTLARVDQSTCLVLKGSVTCLDCHSTEDLSGIKILVKCNQVKKLAMATTEKHGLFQTELPSDTPTTTTTTTSSTTLDCQASILGSSQYLYVSKKKMITSITSNHQSSNSFTLSEPLEFYTRCPLSSENDGRKYCVGSKSKFESSKTVDLPVPREWGLAPTSYYVPFFPIIGIP